MMFATSPDAQVREAMDMHFGIITGMLEMTAKSDSTDTKYWGQCNFVNFVAFRDTFTIAVSRGMCSAAEIAAGNEVLEILNLA
jgi:hypothetical protein